MRHVDEGFALAITSVVWSILDLQPGARKTHHTHALSTAGEVIEDSSCGRRGGPSVSVLRAVVMIIEDALREKADEMESESTNASQEVTQ